MTEYIEKATVMRILERTLDCLQEEGDKYGAYAVDSLLFEIKELPAADVAPVVHARWDVMRDPYGEIEGFLCACGYESPSASNYCPGCGASMDAEDE